MGFVSYVQAIAVHWWALMSCAVFTAIGVAVVAFNKSNRWALWATFGAAVVLLFVASFLAWRDQYQRAEDLLKQLAVHPADLSFQAVQAIRDQTTKPPTMQAIIVLLNSSANALTYQIEKFDVSLDGQKLDNPHFSSMGGLVAAHTPSYFYYPTFNLDLFKGKERIEGKVEFVARYGNPDVGFTRRLTRNMDIYIRMDTFQSSSLTTLEKDEALK